MLNTLNNSPVFDDFKKAIMRIEEALKLKKTTVTRDSAIKRFELCFDLAWKVVKIYSKSQGMECYSPRDCFKTAFQLGLIEHNKNWIEMIESRNRAVHIYKEEFADEIYSKLSVYLNLFNGLVEKLEKLSDN
jgi:nucleotidyltransferase substrate binding protein (TIGR01987 family)